MSRLSSDKSHPALKSDLIRLIREKGAITYAEFMQHALYAVPDGYYSACRNYDADGDYLTSATLHPAFGAVIALQLHEMWVNLDCPDRFDLLELGSARGELVQSITEFVYRNLPEFGEHLNTHCFDIAPPKQSGSNSKVQDVRKLSEYQGLVGCILSNELLDALPVRKFTVRGGALFEFLLAENSGELVEVVSENRARDISEHCRNMALQMPQGSTVEFRPKVASLASQMANVLARGYVITIDYGYEQDEKLTGNTGASLRGYYKHTKTSSVLTNIGFQDLTAGVDYTDFENCMGRFFDFAGWVSQADFLHHFGIAKWLADCRQSRQAQNVRLMNVSALLKLVDEDGLGKFRIYFHRRMVNNQPLTGLGERAFDNQHPLPDISGSEVKYRSLLDAWAPFTDYNVDVNVE